MNGRSALTDLAKQLSENDDWKDMPIEEQERLLKQLRDSKEEKKMTKIAPSHSGNDIECTLVRLNAEVSSSPHIFNNAILNTMHLQIASLSHCNPCHIWYILSHSKVTDNFAPRTLTIPQVTDACIALFKHTPEEMALKIDAFITAGLPGVLHQFGQNRPTRVKAEI